MRCKACNARLSSLVRTVYVPHPDDPRKKTTIQVEEELCSTCSGVGMAAAHGIDFETSEEVNLHELGLDLPECQFDYYY